ncbi:MAG TPA: pyridoxamine 5'-phosphate oxidase family protein [Burkholderiales bacterium]|jgi:predicted pyridoxine 5'-phosphate oxidase superfamily flavin-nucleotide-binding protein|nr:pyridoxamine 5'-phosphate oxidase family protein [Burkholderiales bacterium]
MDEFYHQASRALQDRFDTRRLADRIEQRLVADHVGDSDRAFIEAADMFFLATVDESGQPSCSYKGGAPGFVRVVDPRTLAFPNYDGNGMFLSMGNIAQSRKVGMLFIDFERPRRMRLSGEARISNDDPLLVDYPEAQFIVRVAVTQVFPNCPRYIHQYRLVERSTYVPKTGSTTPIPNWKKSDWACDVLPEKDPARS